MSNLDSTGVSNVGNLEILAKQVVEGYKYLYEHNIIHRDIKPANILVKN